MPTQPNFMRFSCLHLLLILSLFLSLTISLSTDRSNVESLVKLNEAIVDDDVTRLDQILEQEFDRNPNVANATGWAPIHLAAYYGKEKSIEYLLLHDADLRLVNSRNETALHLAAKSGNAALVKNFFEIVAQKNVDMKTLLEARQTDDKTPIFYAANHEIFAELVSRGADVSHEDAFGMQPIHVAVKNRKLDDVHLLLSRNPSLTSATCCGQSGKTISHLAAEFNIVEIFSKDGDQVFSPFSPDGFGQYPICYAIRNGNIDFANKMAEKSYLITDGECKYNESRNATGSPLHFAAFNSNFKFVELLIEKGANVSTVDSTDDTVLHAVVKGDFNADSELIVKLLLEKDSTLLEKRDTNSLTPFLLAAKLSSVNMARTLAMNGADISAFTEDGYGAVHLAESTQFVDFLISIPQKVPLNLDAIVVKYSRDGFIGGLTPFHVAVKEKKPLELIKYFLSKNVNKNAVTPAGKTGLHLAIEYKYPKALELFLQMDGFNFSIQEQSGLTPFMFAIAKDNILAAEQILARNPHSARDIVPKTQDSPLHLAIHGFYKKQVKLCPDGNTSVDELSVQNSTGCPFLDNYNQVILTFLKHLLEKEGSSLKAKNNRGRTPVHSIASRCHPASSQLASLLSSETDGAIFDEEDNAGDTAFELAVRLNCLGLVVPFLEKTNANCSRLNSQSGMSPLHLAKKLGHDWLAESMVATGRCSFDQLDVCNNRAAAITFNQNIKCNDAPDVPNGKATYESNCTLARAKLTCDYNYVLVGSTTEKVCGRDGKWQNDIRCDRKQGIVSLTADDNNNNVSPPTPPTLERNENNNGIRLSGGGNGYGIVEVLHNGVWGTICDDGDGRNKFTRVRGVTTATVLCRLLGFRFSRADWFSKDKNTSFFESQMVKNSLQPLHLDDFYCYGSESSVDSCRHGQWGASDCSPNENLGVICYDPVSIVTEKVNGDLPISRIRSSTTPPSRKPLPCDTDALFVENGRLSVKRSAAQIMIACNDGYELYGSPEVTCNLDRTWLVRGTCAKRNSTSDFIGGIRLYGGNATVGIVEIVHDGLAGTICDDGDGLAMFSSSIKGQKTATTLCRLLGLNSTRADWFSFHNNRTFVEQMGISNSSLSILLDDFHCSGIETEIDKCRHRAWGIHNCQPYESLGIICYENKQEMPSSSGKAFRESQYKLLESNRIKNIRLYGGGPNFGTVEIIHKGVWGTICDDGDGRNTFTGMNGLSTARVLCQLLGFNSTRANWFSSDKNGTFVDVKGIEASPETIILDDFFCYGHETSIYECQHSQWNHNNCRPQEKLGVICYDDDDSTGDDLQLHPKNTLTTNTRTEIRLRGDSNSPASPFGFVEVSRNGFSGAICDSGMTPATAKVLCRFLGYNSKLADWFSKERNLTIVEQLGIQRSHVPLVLDNLVCDGSEVDVDDCSHSPWNVHGCMNGEEDKRVGVICYPDGDNGELLNRIRNISSAIPEIRLTGGGTNFGIIEVSYLEKVGTICDDGDKSEAHTPTSGTNTAKILCRLLGFDSDRADWFSPRSNRSFVAARSVRNSNKRTVLDNFYCLGHETNINECHHAPWSKHNCEPDENLGVICYEDEGDSYPIAAAKDDKEVVRRGNTHIRLHGGDGNSGYVEVEHNGIWGTICDDGDGIADFSSRRGPATAKVLCHLLGFNSVKAEWFSKDKNSTFTERSSIRESKLDIILDNFYCVGDETDVDSCFHDVWGHSNCEHKEALGVVCHE